MPEPSETKMHRLPIHVGDELSGTTMTLFQRRGPTLVRIAQCDSVGHYATKEECEANAARLELCWNAHDDLIAVVQKLVDKLADHNSVGSDEYMAETALGREAAAALKLAQGGPK